MRGGGGIDERALEALEGASTTDEAGQTSATQFWSTDARRQPPDAATGARARGSGASSQRPPHPFMHPALPPPPPLRRSKTNLPEAGTSGALLPPPQEDRLPCPPHPPGVLSPPPAAPPPSSPAKPPAPRLLHSRDRPPPPPLGVPATPNGLPPPLSRPLLAGDNGSVDAIGRNGGKVRAMTDGEAGKEWSGKERKAGGAVGIWESRWKGGTVEGAEGGRGREEEHGGERGRMVGKDGVWIRGARQSAQRVRLYGKAI